MPAPMRVSMSGRPVVPGTLTRRGCPRCFVRTSAFEEHGGIVRHLWAGLWKARCGASGPGWSCPSHRGGRGPGVAPFPTFGWSFGMLTDTLVAATVVRREWTLWTTAVLPPNHVAGALAQCPARCLALRDDATGPTGQRRGGHRVRSGRTPDLRADAVAENDVVEADWRHRRSPARCSSGHSQTANPLSFMALLDSAGTRGERGSISLPNSGPRTPWSCPWGLHHPSPRFGRQWGRRRGMRHDGHHRRDGLGRRNNLVCSDANGPGPGFSDGSTGPFSCRSADSMGALTRRPATSIGCIH